MNLSEYQKLAFRTCAPLGQGDLMGHKLDLAHMLIGMCSELEELESAIENRDLVNIKEEKGDIMWYVAGYCTMRGFDLGHFIPNIQPLSYYSTAELATLYKYVSKLQGVVKRYIAYNGTIDISAEKKYIQEIVNDCNHSEFYQYLEKNIQKLQARYPDKFSEENAINRNVEKEREILEQN